MENVKVVTRAASVPAKGSVVAAAFLVVVGSPWMVQSWFQRGCWDSIAARESSLSSVVEASCFDIWLR